MKKYASTQDLQIHNPSTEFKTFLKNYLVGSDGSFYRVRKDSSVNEIQPQVVKNGYTVLRLVDTDNQRKTFSCHRVVARLFKPDFDPSLDVDHIDGDKTNNHIENLQCITHRQNCLLYHARKAK